MITMEITARSEKVIKVTVQDATVDDAITNPSYGYRLLPTNVTLSFQLDNPENWRIYVQGKRLTKTGALATRSKHAYAFFHHSDLAKGEVPTWLVDLVHRHYPLVRGGVEIEPSIV